MTDLSSLSRAEKIQLLKLLILKARRQMPEKLKELKKPCRYKFSYGGRGGGKSQAVARILLESANNKRLKILCAREIQNSISDSVHSLLKGLISELYQNNEYTVTDKSITNNRTKSEFIFVGLYQQGTKQSIKSLDGIDICWVEEAQAVRKDSLDVLIPTIRKTNSEIWFTFNRLFPIDPVFEFMSKLPDSEKIVVPINYDENQYCPQELVNEAMRAKAEYEAGQSEDYRHIWLGEPIGLSERAILKSHEIELACARKIEPEGMIEIGADIARHGNDSTVITKRHGMKMTEIHTFKNLSTVEVAHRIMEISGYNKGMKIKVDDTGVGGGVVDYLLNEGYEIVPINFGERADDTDKYPNCISEMWFQFRDNIDQIQLIDDRELKAELIGREYGYDNKGRRQVEQKEKFKKRFGNSPDRADSVLLCFYEKNRELQIF